MKQKGTKNQEESGVLYWTWH